MGAQSKERKGSNFAIWQHCEKQRLPRVGVFGGSFFCLISNSDGFLSRSVSHKILSLSLNAAAEVVMGLDAPRRQNVGRRAMTLEISLFPSKITFTQDIFTFFSFSSEQIFKTTLLKGSVIPTWHGIANALPRPVLHCCSPARKQQQKNQNRANRTKRQQIE